MSAIFIFMKNFRMKNYKQFVFVLIVISMFSCKKKNDEVGLNNPIDLLETTLIDNTEIQSYSFLENTSQFTDNATYALVGAYEDDQIGTLKAYHYTQLRLASGNQNLGSNPICTSVKLFLSHAEFSDGENHTYGDTLVDMPISVWEISDGFDADALYKSTDQLATVKKIGETASDYQPRPSTDQLLEIDIDLATGEEILDKAHLKSKDDFLNEFRGIRIGPSDGSFGAILGFDNLSSFSKMVISYSNDEGDKTLELFLNSTSRRFNQYVPDYTGTDLSSLTEAGDTVNSKSASQTITIQSGTGLGALLKFPNIEKLIDTTQSLAIVKVDLIMSLEDNTTSSFTDEPNEILIAYEVENGLIKIEDDEPVQVSNDGVANGTFNSALFFYDEDTKSYTMPLTGHFESFQKGDIDNLDICIQGFLKETRINRSIISSQLGTNPLKLKFYYTTLK